MDCCNKQSMRRVFYLVLVCAKFVHTKDTTFSYFVNLLSYV